MTPVESLRTNGFWRSPERWSAVGPFTKHLRNSLAYPGHLLRAGNRQCLPLDQALAIPANNPSNIPTQYDFACHTMQDLLRAPGFLDMILPFTETAREYFDGDQPSLYSVNAFWKKPKAQPGWHYDTDDRKIMALFLYGTGILSDEDGPHAYARGTHVWTSEQKDPFHNRDSAPPTELIEKLYGPAGTLFLTDTRGLHNGFPPDKNARLLVWARWGVSTPPISYVHDLLSPVPASSLNLPRKPSSELQFVTRFVVDWGS